MCIYESERVGDGRECESRGWQRESTTMGERESKGWGRESRQCEREWERERERERGGEWECVCKRDKVGDGREGESVRE